MTIPFASRIRSLSRRERTLLLLCAAAVSAFLLYRRAVVPALDEYRRNRASIPARQAEVARFRLAAEGAPRVAQEVAGAKGELAELEKGLVPGDTPTEAAVNLQRMLKPWVERADTRLVSVRGLPPAERGGYVEIALQADLQTSVEGLASLLSKVARSRRILFVKKMNVSGGGAGVPGGIAPSRRETLVASVVVAGLARASGAAGAPPVPESTDLTRRGTR